MTNQTNPFRNLVITILSEDDGISPELYATLVEYAKQEHPNSCDDIFSSVEQFMTSNYVLPRKVRENLREVE